MAAVAVQSWSKKLGRGAVQNRCKKLDPEGGEPVAPDAIFQASRLRAAGLWNEDRPAGRAGCPRAGELRRGVRSGRASPSAVSLEVSNRRDGRIANRLAGRPAGGSRSAACGRAANHGFGPLPGERCRRIRKVCYRRHKVCDGQPRGR